MLKLKLLAATAAIPMLLGACESVEAPPPAKASDRPASAHEENVCQQNSLRGQGPNSNDCSRVPLGGKIHEDDPWGRWNCRTMGNQICGPTTTLAPDAPSRQQDIASFEAMKAQMTAKGQWNLTPGEELLYRETFVENSQNDLNRGRRGYVQAEDGSWVPESFYSK